MSDKNPMSRMFIHIPFVIREADPGKIIAKPKPIGKLTYISYHRVRSDYVLKEGERVVPDANPKFLPFS